MGTVVGVKPLSEVSQESVEMQPVAIRMPSASRCVDEDLSAGSPV